MELLFHIFVASVCICFAYGNSPGPIVECEDNLSCPVARGETPGPPVCLSHSQLCDTMSDCSGGEDETLFVCSETPMFLCDEADGDGPVVTVDALCDGFKDCNNTGKDELNILCNHCLMPYYGNCSYTRECIPKKLFSGEQTACGNCLPGYRHDPDNPDPAGECLEDIIEIGLELLANIFPEDVGTAEVCIVLSGSGIDISGIVIRVSVVPGTAEDNIDYTYSLPNGSDGDPTLTFTPSIRRQCIRIDVTDDCVVEQTETIFVSISPIGDLPDAVALINSNVSLLIEDNDGGNVTVYFEENTYTVTEAIDRHATVCVVIEGERCTSVTVTLFTADGTADGTEQVDYRTINEDLVFHEDTKQCINITIIDDDQVEDLEMFFVNLNTSNSGIETPQAARIYIDDDPTDTLIIGFDMESVTADEGQSAEVCVVIRDGALETQVSVTLVTATGEFQMYFTQQNRRDCELIVATSSAPKFAVAYLSTPDPRVTLEPSIANITWEANSDNDDGDEQTPSSDADSVDPTPETSTPTNDDDQVDPTPETSTPSNDNTEEITTPKSVGFLSNGGSIFGVTFGVVAFIVGALTVYFFLRKKLWKTKRSNGKTSVGSTHSVVTSEGLIATDRNVAYNGTLWAANYTVPHSSAWNRGDKVFIVKSLESSDPTVISNTTAAGGYEHDTHFYEKLAAFQATSSRENTPPTCKDNISGCLTLEAEGFCSKSSAANDKTDVIMLSSLSSVISNNKSMSEPGSDSDSTAVGRSSAIPAIERGSTSDERQSSELQGIDDTMIHEDYESVGQVYEHSVENYGYESMGSVYDQSSIQNGYESLGSIYDRQHSTYETLGSVYEPISLADAKAFQ